MTLDQCINYAIEHNVDISKQMVAIEQQRVQAEIAGNKWMPTVDAQVSGQTLFRQNFSMGILPTTGVAGLPDHVIVGTLQPGVTASMPLYTGGRLRHQTEMEKFSLESATHQLEKARKDIRIQVASYYLQVLYYDGLADVARKQVELSRELVKRAQMLYDEGRRPKSDVADAQARLAADEYELTQHESNVTLSTVDLAQLLNMEDIESLRVDDPSLTGDFAKSETSIQAPKNTYENIVDNYPSILASKAHMNALQHQTEVYKSGFMPQVSLSAGFSTNYFWVNNSLVRDYLNGFSDQIKNNFNPMVGITLSYNLFNGHETRNNVRKARLAIQTGELDLYNAKIALRKELQQAYYNAVTAAGKYQSAVSAEEASRVSFDFNKKKYDEGRGTIFELDEATQKWIQAQQNVVQSKYDFLIRKKILDFYVEDR